MDGALAEKDIFCTRTSIYKIAVKTSAPNAKSKKIFGKREFLHTKSIIQFNGKLKYMDSAQNVLNMNLWIGSQLAIYQVGMKL